MRFQYDGDKTNYSCTIEDLSPKFRVEPHREEAFDPRTGEQYSAYRTQITLVLDNFEFSTIEPLLKAMKEKRFQPVLYIHQNDQDELELTVIFRMAYLPIHSLLVISTGALEQHPEGYLQSCCKAVEAKLRHSLSDKEKTLIVSPFFDFPKTNAILIEVRTLEQRKMSMDFRVNTLRRDGSGVMLVSGTPIRIT